MAEQEERDKYSMKKEEGFIREPQTAFTEKQSGEFTVEDYRALPDDLRAELIDGIFYIMESPSFRHQAILGSLYKQLTDFIESRGGSCIPVLSPMDVQLDCDEKTMIQPDVLVLCDRSKIREWGIYGAPDLVMEILSASTARKDTGLKLTKYRQAKVREYWIIDPEKCQICVYDFRKEIPPALYGWQDAVPVRIFDGDCILYMPPLYLYHPH